VGYARPNGLHQIKALANLRINGVLGSFTIQNGRNFTAASAFTNLGALTIGFNSRFTVTAVYIQGAGSTELAAGVLELVVYPRANFPSSSEGLLGGFFMVAVVFGHSFVGLVLGVIAALSANCRRLGLAIGAAAG
jgi:hypothetical protein